MRFSYPLLATMLLLFFCVSMFAFSPSVAGSEGITAHISKFNASGRCTCLKAPGKPCDPLSYGDNATNHLKNKMTAWGFDRINAPTNSGVAWDEWAMSNDGNYPYGIDSFDIGFLYTHGNNNSNGSWATMGTSATGQECSLNWGKGSSNDVRWGNTDVNLTMHYSCNSVNYNAYLNFAYWSIGSDSPNGGTYFATLGFNGYGQDGSYAYEGFKGFVNNSRVNSLGRNWLAWQTDINSGSNNDICPAVIIWADSLSEANYIYQYAGLMDYKNKGRGRMYYYDDRSCHPENP